ncbi:MAG TPA: GGDEF domain-containing protein [Nitrospiria bacterium]|nr:GGDEF domain-containing protein [Nitrospiria bacterium]
MFGATVPLDHGTYQQALQMETCRSIRYAHFFSVCHIGIDQDDLTTEVPFCSVATIVRETIRETDLIGLTNGQTISILLLHADIQSAYQIAERIRSRIALQTFVNERHPLKVTASIGGACFPTHGNDAQTLLLRADEMLALAQRNGGNQTSVPDI